jgi:hypothetical protein
MGFARLSELASESVSGMDQLVDALVGAFSVVVVRPARMAAREHSHFGCAAYACEKTMPRSASFSVLGVLKFLPLLKSFPAIISTDKPAQLWSSAKIKRKFGGACVGVVVAEVCATAPKANNNISSEVNKKVGAKFGVAHEARQVIARVGCCNFMSIVRVSSFEGTCNMEKFCGWHGDV